MVTSTFAPRQMSPKLQRGHGDVLVFVWGWFCRCLWEGTGCSAPWVGAGGAAGNSSCCRSRLAAAFPGLS